MNQVALQFHDDGYPARFWKWYDENKHIYYAFEQRALKMAMSGRAHYSARTIVEVIRWDTDLSDSEVPFKINGNYVPGMARLFMERFGSEYPKFFRCRDSLGRDL